MAKERNPGSKTNEASKDAASVVAQEVTKGGVTAPALKQVEEKEAQTHEPPAIPEENLQTDLIKKYGEDYITAERDGETTYFTKQAWRNLEGDKGGWKRQIKTPPEVAELENKN